MISLYNFEDFRAFMRARLAEMPKKGYGQSLKLAVFLGVHTTLVSQVLKGIKTFTLEQGALTAEFFGLSENETEYFLLLIQLERAGNESLRKSLRRQKDRITAHAMELVNRLTLDTKLSEEKNAIFYSDWIYSAARQLVAIEGFGNIDQISERLRLSKKRAREVIDFLLSTGLMKEEKGKLKVGVKRTHLESTSPWVRVHHSNWRMKAISALSQEEPAKIHYTCPMTLSVADSLKVREMIAKFLESVDKLVVPSESEELRCLNIDWFKV